MTDRVDITRKAIAEMIGVIWQFHEEDKYELVDDESLIKKLDRKLLKLLNESKTGDWVAENLGEAITKILSRPGGFEIGRSPIFLRYQIKFKKQISLKISCYFYLSIYLSIYRFTFLFMKKKLF